jgi:arylsulfatase A-like enzyme
MLTALVVFASPHIPARASEDRPNFIVIMIDDMGYAGLSCFGNPYFKTPHIDRLAAEGMRLSDFHSSGTVCSPTRAGLLTGRYQQRAGIEAVIHPSSDHAEHRKGLQLKELTFAELLQSAGYSTGIVGKWHLGYPQNSDDYHPQNHGFDEFIGYHSGNIDFVSHVGDHLKHDWWHGRDNVVEAGYATDLINDYAVAFIEGHYQEPFCLYVPHLAIHNPIQERGDPVQRTEQGWNRWTPESEPERIDKFRGMTLPVDEGVGRILDTLQRLAIDDQTLIFLFCDNGPTPEAPSGHPELRGLKGSVYEGGHKVPFIARWPSRIAAGKVNNTPAISIDIMPTMLSMAGVPLPDDRLCDGLDLSPVLLEGKTLAERSLYWASLGNNGSRTEAIREGPWKLVVSHPRAKPGSFENEHVELYNLQEDASETKDLSTANPDQTLRLLTRLKSWYADTQRTATLQPGGW